MWTPMEELAPPATEAEAHREWHWNTGNPIGRTTCPWDACHPLEDEPDITHVITSADGTDVRVAFSQPEAARIARDIARTTGRAATVTRVGA